MIRILRNINTGTSPTYLLKHKKIKLADDKPYLLIFDNYSGPSGIFHWFADGLTRLIEIKDIIKNYTALIPYYFLTEKIYKQTLDLFGVNNVSVIKENTYIKVKNLFVPDHIAESGNFHPENVDKLRTFIWDKIPGKANFSKGKRIYVSRAKATRRFVTNEQQVEDLLSKFGFQTVFMEDYSFAEPVSIAYNADIFVSIHGGALTLIHFMRPQTSVLEFRNKTDEKNCNPFCLADALDINYYYLRATLFTIAKQQIILTSSLTLNS